MSSEDSEAGASAVPTGESSSDSPSSDAAGGLKSKGPGVSQSNQGLTVDAADELLPPNDDESIQEGPSSDPALRKKTSSTFTTTSADSVPGSKSGVFPKSVLDFLQRIQDEHRSAYGPVQPTVAKDAEKGPEPSSTMEISRKKRPLSYVSSLLEGIKKDSALLRTIEEEVSQIVAEHPALNEYEVIYLYDCNLINRTHVSAMYQGLASCKRNVLVILKSPGGQVEPAYLISKLCNRFKLERFIVGVPAEAKSAATLLALGADEIHMGAMSELGPIDPQVNEYPALAFSSALEKIAQIAQRYPGSSQMLALYLKESGLNIQDLGHYDRITESSTQYALRLLESKVTDTQDADKVKALASYFTNHYKDHNFVIDVEEAEKLLGSGVVKSETEIYHACHDVHKFLELAEFALAVLGNPKKIIALGKKFHLRDVES